MKAKQTRFCAKLMSYLCFPDFKEQRVGVFWEFVLNIEMGKIQQTRQNVLEGSVALFQM